MNALGELGSRHPLDIQRFEINCLVIADEICRYFMSEIGPLAGDPLMRSGKSFPRLCSIFRTFDFSAEASTQFPDLSFTLTKEFRGRLSISRVGHDHTFQPKIDSRTIRNEDLCRFLKRAFCVDRDEPPSTMISSKCRPFDRSLDPSALDHLHVAEFGNEDFSIFDLDISGNSKRLNRVMFFLNFGNPDRFLKYLSKA
jgi:hypothetical protein